MARSLGSKAVDFVLGALADCTYGDDQKEVGMYIVTLIIKDDKGVVEPELLKLVEDLLAETSAIGRD
ncbi:hypothetical protein L4D77_15285 [Photobacterium frigidiphilum]|uniref:hypothetical protein n=1 Tax=Photobacterium frigidiphilum TaxID=264736 RepID=UPI003D09B92C